MSNAMLRNTREHPFAAIEIGTEGTPLALCQGMPRLTSYYLFARAIPNASTHNPCALGTPLAPCQGMPRLTSYYLFRALFPMASTHNPCALGTPLALCQGMPRLTSYYLFARAIPNGIHSQSMRIRHAPGSVPNGVD